MGFTNDECDDRKSTMLWLVCSGSDRLSASDPLLPDIDGRMGKDFKIREDRVWVDFGPTRTDQWRHTPLVQCRTGSGQQRTSTLISKWSTILACLEISSESRSDNHLVGRGNMIFFA